MLVFLCWYHFFSTISKNINFQALVLDFQGHKKRLNGNFFLIFPKMKRKKFKFYFLKNGKNSFYIFDCRKVSFSKYGNFLKYFLILSWFIECTLLKLFQTKLVIPATATKRVKKVFWNFMFLNDF